MYFIVIEWNWKRYVNSHKSEELKFVLPFNWLEIHVVKIEIYWIAYTEILNYYETDSISSSRILD